jgi:hypothetical protein
MATLAGQDSAPQIYELARTVVEAQPSVGEKSLYAATIVPIGPDYPVEEELPTEGQIYP